MRNSQATVLESRSCTLCGPRPAKRVKYRQTFHGRDLNETIFSARRSPDGRHFRLVTCNDCGIIFSDPACAPEKLKELYRGSQVDYQSQEHDIYTSYRPILDRALAQCSHRNTFVEVGGGSGFMLRYGVEQGFHSQIEIEPSTHAHARFKAPSEQARFVCDIFHETTLPANTASLLCCFQVLDHLPAPMQFMRAVWRSLEPGGVVLVITHNTQAASAHLLGRRSPIFDIEHTYLFNPANLTKLFQAANFKDVSVFPISNAYSVRHWLHIAPGPRKLKKILGNCLTKLRLGDAKIKLRAGNIAAIGVKPSTADTP